MDLTALRDQYAAFLFEDFLPFMDEHVVDHEFGGFLCHTDYDGRHLKTDKYIWWEGRGIWVYSFLYSNLAREQKYLDIAARTVDFIGKHARQDDGNWAVTLTRAGEVIEPFSNCVYGNLFVAEGLSQFALASGDEEYMVLAKEILAGAVELYDRPEIHDESGRLVPQLRRQGTWMVLLRVATQMLQHRPDEYISRLAARCVDAVVSGHWNADFRLNIEDLNHDMSVTTDEAADGVQLGHSMETLWMLLAEALRIGDEELFHTCAERLRRHVEVAWDDVYGGLFWFLKVAANEFVLEKLLWPQADALIGMMSVIEHTNAPWAVEWFERVYDYLLARFVHIRHGRRMWTLEGDRKVTFEPHTYRIENYHHPRHLMLNLLSLGRQIDGGGEALQI